VLCFSNARFTSRAATAASPRKLELSPFATSGTASVLWGVTSTGSEITGELSEKAGFVPAATYPLLPGAFYTRGKKHKGVSCSKQISAL
jgi:hypothetical protein